MAKRKTPKVENLRPEKIDKKELEAIQTIGTNIRKLQADLGALETEKHSMLHMIANLQNSLHEYKDNFNKKYGTDNISMADGTIKYNEDEHNKADKKDNDR